jgi:hypothetical protein
MVHRTVFSYWSGGSWGMGSYRMDLGGSKSRECQPVRRGEGRGASATTAGTRLSLKHHRQHALLELHLPLNKHLLVLDRLTIHVCLSKVQNLFDEKRNDRKGQYVLSPRRRRDLTENNSRRRGSRPRCDGNGRRCGRPRKLRRDGRLLRMERLPPALRLDRCAWCDDTSRGGVVQERLGRLGRHDEQKRK